MLNKKITAATSAILAAVMLCAPVGAEKITDYGEKICKEYIRLCREGDSEALDEFYSKYMFEDGGVEYKNIERSYFGSDTNYIITVKFRSSNDYKDYDDCFHFYFMLTDGTEYNTFDKSKIGDKRCLLEKERQVYTTAEIIKLSGVTDIEKIFAVWLYYGNGYNYDTEVENITFTPCQNGWNKIDGKKYYIRSDGTPAVSNITIDGIRYNFGKDGVCRGKFTGLEKTKNGRRYYKKGKALADAEVKLNGVMLHTDEKGYVSENEARLSDFVLPDSDEFYGFEHFDEARILKKIQSEAGWDKQDVSCININGEYYEIFEKTHSEALNDWEELAAEAGGELLLNGYDDIRRADAFALYDGVAGMPAKLYKLSDSEVLIADYNLYDSNGKAVGAVSSMDQVQYHVCRKPKDNEIFQRGWNIIGGDLYYITEQHIETTGNAVIDGVCYEFTKKGVFVGRHTGWLKLGGGMQYREDGIPLCNTEITLSGGRRYRLDQNGMGTRILNNS